MRINRFLASCGLGSRRNVESLIDEKRVFIDGELCLNKATQVEIGKSIVKVDDKRVSLSEDSDDTWIFNKPAGFLCTREDPQNRKSIYEFLSHLPPPYQAVGRLDKNTRGLLLITKDGELSNFLMHPRYEIKKRYEVRVNGNWKPSFSEKLQKGVQMKEGGSGRMKVLEETKLREGLFHLILELKEGKKREIRYSLEALHLKVVDLQRTHIEFLNIKGLKEGQSRALNDNELKKLEELKI